MSAAAARTSDGRISEQALESAEHFEDELVMDLERDQFVAHTAMPVSRAALSPAATTALWALRIFVVLVSAMVVYTFIVQLN